MGGGTPVVTNLGGVSGQGGGRIMPGTSTGVGELILVSSRIDVDARVDPAQVDRRPTPPYGAVIDTAFTAPGGGPGQSGAGDGYAIWFDLNAQTPPGGVYPLGGGGGGWGGSGGSATAHDASGLPTRGQNLGAAGGKAIDTNGHSVTWLGGANRVYGAVG